MSTKINNVINVGGYAKAKRGYLFENLYPVPYGAAYNSYVISDKKTVLFDTADERVRTQYFKNLKALKTAPDYIVITHIEPDHSAHISRTVDMFPGARLILNAKSQKFALQFYPSITDKINSALIVSDGEELNIGETTLKFIFAPMVHWPEVMVVLATSETQKLLFSADAFGAFGFDKESAANEFKTGYFDAYRRYYTNIVGKYGASVNALFAKLPCIPDVILPLHGEVLEGESINTIIDLYKKWANYEPDTKGVVIFVGSVYGHTAQAARFLKKSLSVSGINTCIVDTSSTDVSYAISLAFAFSHIVFASSTYNMEALPPIKHLLSELKSRGFKNRTAFIIENGTWAPNAAKYIKEALPSLDYQDTVTFLSDPSHIKTCADLIRLAKNIKQSIESV